MAKKKEIKTLDDLKLDEKNFNKHTSEGMKLLRQSIERNKLGRSVLVDKDGNLIAGNGVTETLKGMPEKPNIKVVDTDGSELVVVRRTDLEIDSREARELALADNAIAYQNLAWDEKNLKKAVEEFKIAPSDWGCNNYEKQDWDPIARISEELTPPDINKEFIIKIAVSPNYKAEWPTIRASIEEFLLTLSGCRLV